MRSPGPNLAVVVSFLLLALLLDTVPRFALGDSESYLGTRLGVYLPDDRSWLYGLVASAVTRHSRDLATVAIAQILAAWLSAVLLARVLAQYFRLGPWFSTAAVGIVFVNPLSFYWARGFMTDTAAASVFAALVALVFASRGIAVTALGSFLCAIAICALRSVYLPPLILAFGAVAALCFLRLFRSALRREDVAARWRSALRYSVITSALLLAMTSYALINSVMLRRAEISTNYATTRFLVSAWSPLMAQPVAALDLPPRVTDNMLPLSYDNRLASAFSGDGIVERMANYFGGYQAADPAYKHLLRAAVRDRPLDFLALIARSWSDYINPLLIMDYHREKRFTGTTDFLAPDVLPPGMVSNLEGWNIWQKVAPALPQVSSFGLRYYALAGGWWAPLVSIHATFALLFYIVLPRRNRTDDVLAIQLFAFAYLAMIALTTNALVTRYLIPMDIPLLVTMGALFGNRIARTGDAVEVPGGG